MQSETEAVTVDDLEQAQQILAEIRDELHGFKNDVAVLAMVLRRSAADARRRATRRPSGHPG